MGNFTFISTSATHDGGLWEMIKNFRSNCSLGNDRDVWFMFFKIVFENIDNTILVLYKIVLVI